MQPDPPSDAERKVIRWFFGVAFVVAAIIIVSSWYGRRQECVATCKAQGSPTSTLRMNEGGRFDIGTHCECGEDG